MWEIQNKQKHADMLNWVPHSFYYLPADQLMVDINNQLTFFNVEFALIKLEAAMIEFSVIYVTKTSHSIS